MQIPKEVRKGVVFLGYRNAPGEELFAGTAFYVSRRIAPGFSFNYLVTAKHVIEDIRGKRADKVLMRANLINGRAEWIETNINDWKSHPNDASVDVAVKRTVIIDPLDHLATPISDLLTTKLLEPKTYLWVMRYF